LSQASALRATLEHVARGAEARNFKFPVFRGAKVKLREHVGSYRNHHRADTRENPFRYQHFGIDLRRFGTGSGSSQVRAVLICCTSWVFLMHRTYSTPYFREFWGPEFRDRLGRLPDREHAKIIPLPIFNLLAQLTSVTLTHNPLVGSLPTGHHASPPGATTFFVIFQLFIRNITHGTVGY
jgi:hypothetical protein